MKNIKIYITNIGNINENLITKELHEKILTYGSEKVRLEALTSASFLRELLMEKKISNPTFKHNKFGKPYLKNDEHYFNISHSYNYLAVVFAQEEVGIDIELIDFKAARVKRKFTDLATLGNEADFYTKLWVLKEGFMKYLGVGMTIPLKEITIEVTDEKEDLFKVSYLNSSTSCRVVKFEDYYIGVCLDNISNYNLTIERRF